jgi:hypothetical protein
MTADLKLLQEEMARRGPDAYLLTVDGNGRPRSVPSTVRWDGGELVATAGDHSIGNAAERPLVSLLWPAEEPGGYSLMVDADADAGFEGETTGAGTVRARPTRGVLHRSGEPAEPGGTCTSDCVPLFPV